MTNVFISYAREDFAKAKRVAAAIERDGHSVWWDQNIGGGDRFAAAIEESLANAEAVVVLWSETSARSAWVCDEAAEGRDRDRLVPVVIDKSRPPLGFRQFHTIDLSRWGGRNDHPALAELRAAIESKGAAHEGLEQPRAEVRRRSWWAGKRIAAFAALLLVVTVAGFFAWSSYGRASKPTIAIIPFTDLSPGHDKAYLADGMSEAILTMLAKEPGISVIGRTSAEQFKGQPQDLARMRKALGFTHVLEGSAQPVGAQLRMSVRLIDARNGQEVWAEDYRRQITNIFALQDDIGEQVARKLKGTFTPRALGTRARTQVDTYTLYLAARSKMRERSEESLKQALAQAQQVIEDDPDYGPGHALYADLINLLADTSYGQIPAASALKIAVSHANRAIQLAPNSAEGYAALGAAWAQIDGNRAIQPLERALEIDPSRAELRLWLAAAQNDVGQNSQALENLKRGIDVDPLLRPAVWRLVVVYAASGDFEEAERVIDAYQSRGGVPGWAEFNRGVIERYRGNSELAVAHYRNALRTFPDSRQILIALAFAYHDLGQYNLAGPLVSREKPLLRAYMENSGDAARLARDAPVSAWFGDDLDTAVEILATSEDWRGLGELYDEPGAPRERACRLPLAAGRLAFAMRQLGRNSDSSWLISCSKRALALQQQGAYRNEFWPVGLIHAAKAQILALDGNWKAAFGELQQAGRSGFRTPAGAGLKYLPPFARMRGTPAFAQAQTQLETRPSR